MAESKQQKPGQSSRTLKYVWLVSVLFVLVLAAIFLYKTGINTQSVKEQLAAIEAERAIPDEENAALIYNRLLKYFDKNRFYPDFHDPNLYNNPYMQPWTSRDYPQLATFLKNQESTITTLLEATAMEKCRFPIIIDIAKLTQITDRLSSMRYLARFLTLAANNDLGEGRADEALQKYFAVLQMAEHLYQQPTLIDYLVGCAIEGLGTSKIKMYIMQYDVTYEQLDLIERKIVSLQNTQSMNWNTTCNVERLSEKINMRNFSFVDKLKLRYQQRKTDAEYNDIYRRFLSERNSIRILISLRRYKIQNKTWPVSLDFVKSLNSKEIFIDPINEGAYIYKLDGETFTLYSKGKNNIDENGRYNSIWNEKTMETKVKEDDRMIWPTKYYKKQQEDADAQ